jgi:hypothetical protein
VAGIWVLRGRRVPGYLLLLPARPGSDDRGPQERDSTAGAFGTALPRVFISDVFLFSSHAPRGWRTRSPVTIARPGAKTGSAGEFSRPPRTTGPGFRRGAGATRLPAGPAPGPMPLPFQCVRADRGA